MARLKTILAHLDRAGLGEDQPFAIAHLALRGRKDDWASAALDLQLKAKRFAAAGMASESDLLNFSAKILLFYGRGF